MTSQLLLFLSFVGLYIALFVKLVGRLRNWSYEVKGQCYHSTGIILPNGGHPRDDLIYVTTTFTLNILSFVGCVLLTKYALRQLQLLAIAAAVSRPDLGTGFNPSTNIKGWSIRLKHRLGVLTRTCLELILRSAGPIILVLRGLMVTSAIGQYPIHLYMAIRLRRANRDAFGAAEDEWGFGQVLAVVLLLPIFVEIGQEYVRYQRECQHLCCSIAFEAHISVERKTQWENKIARGQITSFGSNSIDDHHLRYAPFLAKRLSSIEKRRHPESSDKSDHDAALDLVRRAKRRPPFPPTQTRVV